MARLAIGISVLLLASFHFAAFPAPARADSRDKISPLLVRALSTKWPTAMRNPPERIQRNDAGKVVRLWLDGVQLEPGDIERICSFKELERLSLSYTSISDQELARLADLPRLQGLVLSNTAIGDDGVAGLAKFPELKSVCMFRVHASPEAVRALGRERKLAIGYAPLGR
jgi:hypothetical protein